MLGLGVVPSMRPGQPQPRPGQPAPPQTFGAARYAYYVTVSGAVTDVMILVAGSYCLFSNVNSL